MMVLYLISLKYIFFFTPIVLSSSSPFCPKRLLWHEKSFYDDTQSFRLQICCNVTRLWLVQLMFDWRLASSYNGGDWQWKNVETLTLPGFDLILSKCDNQTMLGDIVNPNCKQERGKIITLSQNADQLSEFDQWYVMCYEWIYDKDSQRRCVICRLDKFCTNHGRCRDTFINVEVVNATLSSFTVLLHVGDIPFGAQINVEASNAYQQVYSLSSKASGSLNNVTKKDVHYKSFLSAPRNKTLVYNVTNLKSDSWYHVNVCMIVRTPSWFRSTYPNINLPDEHIFCIKDEGRTSYKRYLSKGAQILRCDYFMFVFWIFLLMSLQQS